jgi:Rod binding domain-containing protein
MNDPRFQLPTSIRQAQLLASGRSANSLGRPSSQHDQLTKQAQRWVAQTFYGTLLKQMRDDPFKSEIFDGGHGGEAFQSLLDQHLADHMSRSAGQKLVKAIVRKIEAAQAYKKQSKVHPEQNPAAHQHLRHIKVHRVNIPRPHA